MTIGCAAHPVFVVRCMALTGRYSFHAVLCAQDEAKHQRWLRLVFVELEELCLRSSVECVCFVL